MIEGEEGGLFERVAGDEKLGVSAAELEAMARPEGLVGRAVELEAMARPEGLVGRAVEQVERFLAEVVAPVVVRGGGWELRWAM